jgi:hypothetical protein
MKECVAVKTDFKYEEAGLKKVMLLAAVMAMVMAAAVPALAQTVTQAGDGSIACVQTAVQQNNVIGNNISNENAQAVAQECNISVTQVNTAVSKYLNVDKGKVVKYQYSSATASASAKAPAAVQYKYSAPAAAQYEYKYSAPAAVQYQYSSASAAPAALPSTGGASLIALGAGVLLVAGGLLARRIVR